MSFCNYFFLVHLVVNVLVFGTNALEISMVADLARGETFSWQGCELAARLYNERSEPAPLFKARCEVLSDQQELEAALLLDNQSPDNVTMVSVVGPTSLSPEALIAFSNTFSVATLTRGTPRLFSYSLVNETSRPQMLNVGYTVVTETAALLDAAAGLGTLTAVFVVSEDVVNCVLPLVELAHNDGRIAVLQVLTVLVGTGSLDLADSLNSVHRRARADTVFLLGSVRTAANVMAAFETSSMADDRHLRVFLSLAVQQEQEHSGSGPLFSVSDDFVPTPVYAQLEGVYLGNAAESCITARCRVAAVREAAYVYDMAAASFAATHAVLGSGGAGVNRSSFLEALLHEHVENGAYGPISFEPGRATRSSITLSVWNSQHLPGAPVGVWSTDDGFSPLQSVGSSIGSLAARAVIKVLLLVADSNIANQVEPLIQSVCSTINRASSRIVVDCATYSTNSYAQLEQHLLAGIAERWTRVNLTADTFVAPVDLGELITTACYPLHEPLHSMNDGSASAGCDRRPVPFTVLLPWIHSAAVGPFDSPELADRVVFLRPVADRCTDRSAPGTLGFGVATAMVHFARRWMAEEDGSVVVVRDSNDAFPCIYSGLVSELSRQSSIAWSEISLDALLAISDVGGDARLFFGLLAHQSVLSLGAANRSFCHDGACRPWIVPALSLTALSASPRAPSPLFSIGFRQLPAKHSEFESVVRASVQAVADVANMAIRNGEVPFSEPGACRQAMEPLFDAKQFHMDWNKALQLVLDEKKLTIYSVEQAEHSRVLGRIEIANWTDQNADSLEFNESVYQALRMAARSSAEPTNLMHTTLPAGDVSTVGTLNGGLSHDGAPLVLPYQIVLGVMVLLSLLLAIALIRALRRCGGAAPPRPMAIRLEEAQVGASSTMRMRGGSRSSVKRPTVSTSPRTGAQQSTTLLALQKSGDRQGDDQLMIDGSELSLQEAVGRGQFGVVHRAKYRGKTVAVKQLKDRDTIVDEKKYSAAVVEFQGEALLYQRLPAHRNITSFIGVVQRPLFSIVTEYLVNGSLSQLIYSESTRVATDWFQRAIAGDILRGMAHLHSHLLIHRDIASRNVLLDEHFTGKLADFGLARFSSARGATDTTVNTVGPVKWMAPEAMKDHVYSEKTDIWSFGATLVELVSRSEPFPGVDPVDVILCVTEGASPSVPESASSPLMKNLIASCFAANPDDRPTAKELLRKIKESA